MQRPASADRGALGAALFCYTTWGLFPLLFQAAGRAGASPWEIVAWRTAWAAPFAAALVWVTGRGPQFYRLLHNRRAVLTLLLSSALIAVNWTLYVWSVDTHRTLSASLGYYINPLLNMAAGAWLFRERVDRTGWIAVALAAVGVVLQGVALRAFPWVSLGLAFSFGGYGLVRKRAHADAQTGLLVECLVLMFPALAYAAWLAHAGTGHFGAGFGVTALLTFCGPATVLPLAAFALAMRRLPLTVMGFLQFVSPTLQFLIGLMNGEAFTPLRALSFLFIWVGAAVFAGAALWRSRAAKEALAEPA